VGELDFVKRAQRNARIPWMLSVTKVVLINGEIVVEDKKGETESKPWMNVMSPLFASVLFEEREYAYMTQGPIFSD
jgi:hypothetical protein